MKIFFDQTGHRWKVAKAIATSTLGFWAICTVIFVFSIIFITPPIADLLLFRQNLSSKTPDQARQNPPTASASEDYRGLTDTNTAAASNHIIPSPFYKDQTMAFFTGDENGLNSLSANAPNIDILLPLWLSLDGQTISLNTPRTEDIKAVTTITSPTAPNLKIMPVFSNYDDILKDWNGAAISRLLNDAEAQKRLIEQLKTFTLDNHFAGISLDMGNISSTDQPKYLQFVRDTRKIFEQNQLLLSINFSIDTQTFDYKAYANSTDFIIIRAYDEHWLTSTSGPIASQKWFEEHISRVAQEIPNDKLVIALGAFGYDWEDGATSAVTISFPQAVQLARESKTDIIFDSANLNSSFEYYNNDKHHQVYLFDAISAFNEKHFASSFQPKGYALWKLGYEDNSVWSVLKTTSLADQLAGINTIKAFNTIDYQGTGDVLKVKTIPQEGTRTVTYDDKINLITKVLYKQLPAGYIIGKIGKETKNTVTLTFDDGPDPTYTPDVLKILEDYKIKATFFVIGSNAQAYPDLLKKIFKNGNLIGNHTFTHPNIAEISDSQLLFELNSTQLLIESLLNVKTLVFRPPYDQDINPQTLSQAKPINQVSKAGYVTVGNSIDPKDWEEPGVKQIVDETIRQTIANQGGVVLLHDGGGDRSQTIAALPAIIEGLQAAGFRIVPLNEMIGVKPEIVNTPIQQGEYYNIMFNLFYIRFFSFSQLILQILIYFGLFIGLIRFVPIGVMAIIQTRRHRRKIFDEDYTPSVSVVIAAYNEEKVIKETIENVLQSIYDKSKFEVIVINDGSTDNTWQILSQHYTDHPNVKIFSKTNGGKSAAVNYGIKRTTGEIMVSLDADTLVDPHTVNYLVRHFSDPRIGAVAGNAKVGNRDNLLTKFQALEYIISQNLDKRAFDLLNAITVVPGAIGAWRISLVKEIGGLDESTLAEDSDLTLQIIRKGYIVHYEEDGVAYTEAPTSIRTLSAQRFRWAFGTLQVLVKNKSLIVNPRLHWLGMIGLPNVIYFQFFSPLVTPIVDIALLSQIILAFIQLSYNSQLVSIQQFAGLFIYYAIFTVLDLASSIVAFSLEKKENWKLMFWMLPQRFFYRFFLNLICLKSLVSAVKGNAIGWNKLDRKGTIKSDNVDQIIFKSTPLHRSH